MPTSLEQPHDPADLVRAELADGFLDHRVYDVPWNKVKAGDPIDAGLLDSYARKHKAKFPDDTKLLDWYLAVVGRVSYRCPQPGKEPATTEARSLPLWLRQQRLSGLSR